MRRIVFAVCTTVTGLVLLFSWPTSLNRTTTAGTAGAGGAGDAGTGATTSGTRATTSGTRATTSGTGADAATTPPATTPATTPATPTPTTYDGAAASTRYGNVQVRITVTDQAVTAAEAIDYPHQNGTDRQINAYAIPILNQDAVAAQSANIQMVSGASFTSGGYVQSLQDALDQAGL